MKDMSLATIHDINMTLANTKYGDNTFQKFFP